jgi:hypothetical protein
MPPTKNFPDRLVRVANNFVEEDKLNEKFFPAAGQGVVK